MMTKYNVEINNQAIIDNLRRLIGQVYKLLPYREEGRDWETPLRNIQKEFAGMNALLENEKEFQKVLFSLECRLEGLSTNISDDDFALFRSNVFDCINRINTLIQLCQD